jgi:hypothetical protein
MSYFAYPDRPQLPLGDHCARMAFKTADGCWLSFRHLRLSESEATGKKFRLARKTLGIVDVLESRKKLNS